MTENQESLNLVGQVHDFMGKEIVLVITFGLFFNI